MSKVKEEIFEALISRTRAVLTEGRIVLIVGKLKSSTKGFLLQGLSTKQISFADAFTKSRSPNVGLILMVRWVSHSVNDKLKSRVN